eukprot:SAG31_NODE_2473_length_5638_cov_3.074134_3_plen_309_part_00
MYYPSATALIVAHTIQTQVVVHAPTIDRAQGAFCRAYSRTTNSTCCLISSDCIQGLPVRCHAMCAQAITASPPPQHCMALGWFHTWYEHLGVLCANVSTSSFNRVSYDICETATPIHACDKTVVFAGGQPDCSVVLSSPSHQLIRLTMVEHEAHMRPGDRVVFYDGPSQDQLAHFNGLFLHIGPQPQLDSMSSLPCPAALAENANTLNTICCEPPATCEEGVGVPNICSVACAETFLPFYDRCTDFVRSNRLGALGPQLVQLADECVRASLAVNSTSSSVRIVYDSGLEDESHFHASFAAEVTCIDRT